MKIGDVLRQWRRGKDKGIREAAKEMEISHGTLSRIERGEKMDANTLLKLFKWLFGEGEK